MRDTRLFTRIYMVHVTARATNKHLKIHSRCNTRDRCGTLEKANSCRLLSIELLSELGEKCARFVPA